jgi:hypothetical protein
MTFGRRIPEKKRWTTQNIPWEYNEKLISIESISIRDPPDQIPIPLTLAFFLTYKIKTSIYIRREITYINKRSRSNVHKQILSYYGYRK